jgi:hypothetical protein
MRNFTSPRSVVERPRTCGPVGRWSIPLGRDAVKLQLYSRALRPSAASNSPCVPCSTIRPPSRTKMTSRDAPSRAGSRWGSTSCSPSGACAPRRSAPPTADRAPPRVCRGPEWEVFPDCRSGFAPLLDWRPRAAGPSTSGIGLAIVLGKPTEARYDRDEIRERVHAVFERVLGGRFTRRSRHSVNPHWLAPSLFDALSAAHRRFVSVNGFAGSAIERLGGLWDAVAERRRATPHAPLSAREIQYARAQFETIYDAMMARGEVFPRAAATVLTRALHAHPRATLRPDAAR